MSRRDLPIHRDVVIPGAELEEAASRSGGPGGQHVNKASTRVTLRWNVNASKAVGSVRRARLLERLARRLTREGDLIVHASKHRSRARNRERARGRLAELVRDALAVKRPRRATRPTSSSKLRRVETKRRRSNVKRRRRPPDRSDD